MFCVLLLNISQMSCYIQISGLLSRQQQPFSGWILLHSISALREQLPQPITSNTVLIISDHVQSASLWPEMLCCYWKDTQNLLVLYRLIGISGLCWWLPKQNGFVCSHKFAFLVDYSKSFHLCSTLTLISPTYSYKSVQNTEYTCPSYLDPSLFSSPEFSSAAFPHRCHHRWLCFPLACHLPSHWSGHWALGCVTGR